MSNKQPSAQHTRWRAQRVPGLVALFGGLCCLLLAGCGAVLSQPATPTATPTPQELVEQVVAATRATESFDYAIEFSGAPVYADPQDLFVLLSVEGQFQRPAGARAAIRVRNVGSVAEIRLVSLGGQLYATNPLTREWQCFPAGTLFDPVILFDPQQGLDLLLAEQFRDVSLLGVEELDGTPHYHLRGTMPGPPLSEISFGLLGNGEVEVDVWTAVDSSLVSRLVLVDTGTNPDNPSTWTMTLSNYDGPVDVRAPIDCPTS